MLRSVWTILNLLQLQTTTAGRAHLPVEPWIPPTIRKTRGVRGEVRSSSSPSLRAAVLGLLSSASTGVARVACLPINSTGHRPPSSARPGSSAKCILDDTDHTSQAKANEGATNGGDTNETPANSYALTTYDDDQQPVPLASVPPPSPAGGVAFVPLPVSLQAGGAAAYPATVIPLPALSNPHEIAFQQQHHHHHRQEELLQAFWAGQLAEAEQQAEAGEVKLKAHHSLPLARIKKIMKADADVKMVAAEAPAVFARAREMFILELTLRAWLHAEGARRRTLQRGDVTAAIQSTETYDFLTDIVPEEERSWSKGDGGVPPATMTTTAVPVVVLPPPSYSYGPPPVTSSDPFATYANMQPVTYMWAPPPPEHHHQQNFDGGRDPPGVNFNSQPGVEIS